MRTVRFQVKHFFHSLLEVWVEVLCLNWKCYLINIKGKVLFLPWPTIWFIISFSQCICFFENILLIIIILCQNGKACLSLFFGGSWKGGYSNVVLWESILKQICPYNVTFPKQGKDSLNIRGVPTAAFLEEEKLNLVQPSSFELWWQSVAHFHCLSVEPKKMEFFW